MDSSQVLGGSDLQALSNLLNPATKEDDEDIDLDDKSSIPAMTPGTVGPPAAAISSSRQSAATSSGSSKPALGNSKAIWSDHEILPLERTVLEDDPRPTPDYQVIYKQSIGSEDVFLGLNNRTPSTASCEDMVVIIDVPHTKRSDMQLDVSDTFLDFETPRLKLGLPLPHPVDSKNGKAKWDPRKSQLSITLRMKREYDFMNF
eukprot:scpid29550/ scgid31471/ Uncharacterized protein CXorf41; Sarcoma antigen NY-SAR-97